MIAILSAVKVFRVIDARSRRFMAASKVLGEETVQGGGASGIGGGQDGVGGK